VTNVTLGQAINKTDNGQWSYYLITNVGNGYSLDTIKAQVTNIMGNNVQMFWSRGGVTQGGCASKNTQCSNNAVACNSTISLCSFTQPNGNLYLSIRTGGNPNTYSLNVTYQTPLVLNFSTSGSNMSSVIDMIDSNGEINYMTNIPGNTPSFVTVTAPNVGGGNIRYQLRLINSSTTSCSALNSCNPGSGSSCGFPLFCTSSNPILQIHNTNNGGGGGTAPQGFNITISPLTFNNISTNKTYPIAATSNVQFFSFSLDVEKSIVVNIGSLTGGVNVQLYFGCTLLAQKNCGGGGSCTISRVYVGEALAGTYWVLVTPNNNAGFTILVSSGTTNCFSILSSQVSFCSSFIDPSLTYNVLDVAGADSLAQQEYTAFSAIYNNTCATQLKTFSCNYNFEACDTSTGLTKQFCYEDCNNVATVCGANPCVAPICQQFNPCKGSTTTNTGGTAATGTSTGGHNGAASLISSMLLILILVLANVY